MAALASFLLTGCGAEPAVASIPKSGMQSGARAVASMGPQASAAVKTNADSALIQSVFHSGPNAGRNPFFPNLSRARTASEAVQPAILPVLSYLKLVGLRSGTARPLALINRTPFAPGEEADVTIVVTNALNKPEVQKINIRCLEIRRDSVLITIAGEEGVKELRLAQGI
jgi:hypothetical protein